MGFLLAFVFAADSFVLFGRGDRGVHGSSPSVLASRSTVAVVVDVVWVVVRVLSLSSFRGRPLLRFFWFTVAVVRIAESICAVWKQIRRSETCALSHINK